MSTTETLAELVNDLVGGWHERVEYSVPVCVHTPLCQDDQVMLSPAMLKHHVCMCPLKLEQRVERVYQPSLIDQLTGEASGYAPTTMGTRGGKPGSKPPATLDMLDLVHTLDVMLVNVSAEGKTRVDQLRNLVTLTITPEHDLVRAELCSRIRRYIKTARIMLNYDVPSRVLRDVVCGGCGGTLVVAIDATSDVRCVGKADATSCGQVYRKFEWVDLLDEGEHG